ncbi:hypothetical protein A1O1_01442 [Capronia coronata CBS 617.96]|uniref:Peptidase C45 hydrolase domain-containing protein n=1 Tax=Capronia coronata CBS 617.96 TaxID=1182541 RepID=W9Z3Z6_9EURO|nr:uncharacterized protein A1O1_01442 [Capronia coronata CBS 617.96]EXJ96316.1 hypothetical protein A1O1_01442 [Capronia coronata CBS 617.96]
MVNEAGMLGKIGFNSLGVGVVSNAIRVQGVDPSRIPVHLGLRIVLESASAKEAIAALEAMGMAASAHMLIGDADFAQGCEFTSKTFIKLPIDSRGRIMHSNHLHAEHTGLNEDFWLKDSFFRVEQMETLTDAITGEPSSLDVCNVFKDETEFPFAICRAQEQGSNCATLFSIVMDLKLKEAVVIQGRPTHPDATFVLRLD